MIAAIVPPQAPLQELIHGPLSHPVAARSASDEVVYGIATVGAAGRILDRQLLARLGWTPGTRLGIRCDEHGILVFSPAADGVSVVTADEFFRIPFRFRRRVNVFVGDRVPLIGRRSKNRLAVHPPAAMDELFDASIRLLER